MKITRDTRSTTATEEPQKEPPLIKNKLFIGTLNNLNARIALIKRQEQDTREFVKKRRKIMAPSKNCVSSRTKTARLLQTSARCTPSVKKSMTQSMERSVFKKYAEC